MVFFSLLGRRVGQPNTRYNSRRLPVDWIICDNDGATNLFWTRPDNFFKEIAADGVAIAILDSFGFMARNLPKSVTPRYISIDDIGTNRDFAMTSGVWFLQSTFTQPSLPQILENLRPDNRLFIFSGQRFNNPVPYPISPTTYKRAKAFFERPEGILSSKSFMTWKLVEEAEKLAVMIQVTAVNSSFAGELEIRSLTITEYEEMKKIWEASGIKGTPPWDLQNVEYASWGTIQYS
ncbi:hypothetical protein V8F33_013919 [Rhypophila sp. PSN 637]